MLEIDALKKHIEVLNGQIRSLRKANESTGEAEIQTESVKCAPKAPLLESKFMEHNNEYLSSFTEDYFRTEEKLCSLNATCERQKELIKTLRNENKHLAKKKKELDNENNQLAKKNKELDNENNQLAKKNKELDNENKQLASKNKELDNESEQLVKKNKEFDNKNKQLLKKNEELDNENNQLVIDCIKLNEEIFAERLKNMKLKQQVGENRGQDDDWNNSTEDGENSSQVRYHISLYI